MWRWLWVKKDFEKFDPCMTGDKVQLIEIYRKNHVSFIWSIVPGYVKYDASYLFRQGTPCYIWTTTPVTQNFNLSGSIPENYYKTFSEETIGL